MVPNPPPSGYLNRKVAQSIQEAVQNYTVDHIKTIVKSGIQRYIESFMSQQGGNRTLYETFTKMGLQYIVDKSFDPASDPTLRKTQLARLFEQIHRELPAILIVDSAFEYIPANFTGIDRAYTQQNYWYGTVQIVRQLTCSVIAATRDQSSTDFLQGLLSVMFGELRFLGGGTRIEGNRSLGETWVMMLGNPKLGTVTQDTVTEDPKDKIWSFTIEVPDILFEDSITIKQAMDRSGGAGQLNGVNPADYITNIPPVIYAPDTLPINESVKILFSIFQPEFHRVILSDPNIATFEPQSQTFTPRRLGSVEIQVIRNTKPLGTGNFNEQSGAIYDVVARKTIRIVSN